MHTLMMAEAAPAVLAPLFLEVNSGVIAGMGGLAVIHEMTVLWDLWFTQTRRPIGAGEQVTHTFLESPPFVVVAAAIATHWDEFLALFGKGTRQARYDVRLQRPFVPVPKLLAMAAAMGLLGVLPHVEELRRCVQAARAGRIGADTPPCLPAVH